MSVNSDGGGGGVKVETDSGATNEGKSLQADQCKKLLVDGPCVFSKSILWKIQREFYESHGVQCWQQGVVPNFASSNCYIARSYAYAILGFLRDYWKDKEPSSEPVYIVEAGAGSAKLSYVLVKHLISWRKFWPHEGCFKYIITDFAATNFEFWMNHPSLQHLTEAGLIDYGAFDSENTETLKLELSGLDVTLSKHPIILVANYVFDSLKQDAFVVDRDLCEMLCTTSAPLDLDPTNIDLFRYIECSWIVKRAAIAEDCMKRYYPDKPHWNRVLRMALDMRTSVQSLSGGCCGRYDDNAAAFPVSRRGEGRSGSDKDEKDEKQQSSPRWPFEEGDQRIIDHRATTDETTNQPLSLLMPIGAFTLLDKLRSLSSGGRLMVLVGDKGNTNPSEMIGSQGPRIVLHGSFSCMVNFIALQDYCKVEGGWARFSPSQEGFKYCVMMLGMGEEEYGKKLFPRFRMAIDNLLGCFGPDGFSALQRSMKEEAHSFSLKGALSILRLSYHDPDVFYKFKGVIIDQSPHASSKVQADVLYNVEKVYNYHFPLQPYKDVAFEIGRVCMGLGAFARAAQLFLDSQRSFGVHHVSYFNMGVCHRKLGNYELADNCFLQSLALCPDYPDALKAQKEREAEKQDMKSICKVEKLHVQ